MFSQLGSKIIYYVVFGFLGYVFFGVGGSLIGISVGVICAGNFWTGLLMGLFALFFGHHLAGMERALIGAFFAIGLAILVVKVAFGK